jgi:hypothetical protein
MTEMDSIRDAMIPALFVIGFIGFAALVGWIFGP